MLQELLKNEQTVISIIASLILVSLPEREEQKMDALYPLVTQDGSTYIYSSIPSNPTQLPQLARNPLKFVV